MKYFTADLIERFQSDDPAIAGAADQEWEEANRRYEEYILSLEGDLPANLQAFNRLLLHDATVETMERKGPHLLMELRLDISSQEVIILRYELEEEPVLKPFSRKAVAWGVPTWFDFDEFACDVNEGKRTYSQSIVFGNGWEMLLRFRDVQVMTGTV